MSFFRFRTVLDELEAHLLPVQESENPSSSGKSERKRYGNGEERLKVRARELDLPDSELVDIIIAGAVVAQVQAQGGRIRVDLTSSERSVPAVANGDVLELRISGRPVLRGTFRPD